MRIPRRTPPSWSPLRLVSVVCVATLVPLPAIRAQGVTTGALAGLVTDSTGIPVANANVVAVHVPTGTQYRAVARGSGAYSLPNLRVGGPYTITASFLGFQPGTRQNVIVALGETQRVDFRLARVAAQLGAVEVRARADQLEGTRTGAATFVDPLQVSALPSVKRSTRDLIRIDPRNDGNFSFAGRNWLYNNISLDGSYFNNSFGLDDPAPGGQTNAEPVPFDAVEQVQVSIAPFDVRQGGFTGANVNTVTKSGTNQLRGSAYTFLRNDALIGNEVSGNKVVANPSLNYNQSGISLGGPIIRDKLFFFINGEIERTDDPGSNFVANRGTGTPGFGVSRVDAATMGAIRARLATYNYETGPYEGYVNETNNDKLLAKLDWNVNTANTFVFRYSYLDASRDLPPHPFVLSFANTGRGPNASSLPFRNSGYRINNNLHSIAVELNSRSTRLANRLFVSYNRFRDFREPFSAPFPTIEIGEGGVTYTTAGHEPFSIHNILDQDVWQLTNNISLFRGSHAFTVGANFERFSFFNSFNIFRHGVFFLPASIPPGSTFSSLQEFFQMTDPANPNRKNFNAMIGSGPFKGEEIDVGQFSLYLQDEFFATPRLTLTYGARVDFPTYFTNPVDNPFSVTRTARDENGNPEIVDQAKLPGAKAMLSPRFGFNWDRTGDRSTLLRGGTGVFTGRVPFVWIGNVISNPGANPNLTPAAGAPLRPTKKESVLQQSFDLNAMDAEFRWPQTWTTNVAAEQALPYALRGTIELLYVKDLKNVFMRNADLVSPVRTLPDGRPYYGGFGNNELNADGGAGIYVIDNTNKGYSFNVTAQLRRTFGEIGSAGLGYSFTKAKNALKSTEIASVLWQNQPVQGNPNRPEMSWSEFGQRHRIVGDATYIHRWSDRLRTQIGVFMEVAEGNRFAGAGGNRYSFIYSGDVNGDGAPNDLIYIPRSQSEIIFDPLVRGTTTISPAEQWARFDAFIQQDKYLNAHRGQIAERFGLINPWYTNVDLRIQQDVLFARFGRQHGFQIGLDVMNVGNLINSDWGVRKIADPTATSPLTLMRFDANGVPVFNFTGPQRTFIDDPDLLSRWRAQIGVKYSFQ